MENNSKYFIEVYLRGFAKDHLRDLAKNPDQIFHITLIRTFTLNYSEEKLIQKVSSVCKVHQAYIQFSLKGISYFNNNETITHMPIQRNQFLQFSNDLEQTVELIRNLAPSFREKNLHATISYTPHEKLQ